MTRPFEAWRDAQRLPCGRGMLLTGPEWDEILAALERVPELERQVANLEADLHSHDADYWRERAERVEEAARACLDAFTSGVGWPKMLADLRAALAAAPAEDPERTLSE